MLQNSQNSLSTYLIINLDVWFLMNADPSSTKKELHSGSCPEMHSQFARHPDYTNSHLKGDIQNIHSNKISKFPLRLKNQGTQFSFQLYGFINYSLFCYLQFLLNSKILMYTKTFFKCHAASACCFSTVHKDTSDKFTQKFTGKQSLSSKTHISFTVRENDSSKSTNFFLFCFTQCIKFKSKSVLKCKEKCHSRSLLELFSLLS